MSRASSDPVALSTEAALELFLDARRRGDAVDLASFVARHPAIDAEAGPTLQAALDALVALERATGPRTRHPERIGPYRIVREIGRGGMGVVLEAVEEPLDRRVALKVLPPELVSSTFARARFRREAELAARLHHPGVATVYAAGVDAERPWIAMRYVEGETLARRIHDARAAGATSIRLQAKSATARSRAIAIASTIARVARALQCAHGAGVVHRDVKPSNVILGVDGAPVLVDFGLALATEHDGRSLTASGAAAGTPAYLAPEIVSGQRARPDAQCDVYALGVTLFECLTLKRPHDAPTPVALYAAIGAGSTPDVRTRNREVPRDLAIVVATALERDRARRYASAAAFAEDLEACAAGRPIAARPISLSGRVARWARREPRQAALAGSLAFSVVAAAAFAGTWWQSRAEVRAAWYLTEREHLEETLQEGFMHVATNWRPEADLDFQRALAIDPTNSEALAGRALVRMQEERDAEAVAVLAGAPRTPAFDALRALARREIPEVELGAEWFRSASAIEMFIDGMRIRRQAELSPRHERPRLSSLALARFDEAVRRSWTQRAVFQIQRALAARDAHDEAAMRSAAAALAVLWPDSSRALFTAGTALERIDGAAASPLLERVIALDPTWGAAHQVLGNARIHAEDFDGAETALRRAIAIDPKDADAFNSLGLALDWKGCRAEARAAYLDALRVRPMFETWANIGLLDVDGADPDAAELELRIALAHDPRENQVRVPLAKLLFDRGFPEQAITELEIAIGFDAHDLAAWRQYAAIQSDLGEEELAQRAFAIARELDLSR